ncbi:MULTISPECIES: CaiB/BaiF CoA transferase family protein [Rhodobacterales]|uniref:CaiB/BaiF CoA transferase family protein n=1 Tax=Rhodobacterales TaxID=204455 RepID=UPI000C9635DF|nr:CoA transferase [Heliomarina baculiformis]MAM24169.1 carnitine dehydratase [Paracoccaceae bacterium]HCQ56770.1 carnitine dehydratase [Sulfitobacter sp.]
MNAAADSGPLAGLRVIDLGQVYLGPYCGLMFALMGAEVIKVEPPGGDSIRGIAGGRENPAAMMLNSSKQSVTLDLGSKDGRTALLALADTADVLIENFRPGTMEKLGLGWETLCARNPRLVMGSGKGYAADSVYRDAPAMDFPIQALTGLMSVAGFPDGPPVKCGAAITDFLGGIHLFGGIMAALHARGATGRGDFVQIAMQDVAHHALASNIASFLLASHGFADRAGNSQAVLKVAPYDLFPAQDGQVAIMCLNDRHWQQLIRAMGRPELAEDPDLAEGPARCAQRARVDGWVTAWTSRHTRAEIFAALSGAHVPGAPVRTLAEVVSDEDMRARGMIHDLPHPDLGKVPVPGLPMRFAAHPQVAPIPAPAAGADTARILSALEQDLPSAQSKDTY